MVQRFLREARLASRLDHPYAAHVYAFGIEEQDKLLWIAMERVQGITLAQWLKMHGPMPLPQFVPFFERIASVVQTAHESGILHRDLKPCPSCSTSASPSYWTAPRCRRTCLTSTSLLRR
jgi:serine/threonine-protein kinase